MSMLLELIPRPVLAALVLLAALLAGVQTVRHARAAAALADLRVAIATDRQRQAQDAAAASEAARFEERRRTVAVKGIVDEAEDHARGAGLDAAAARVAGDGLRVRAAGAAAASCRAAASDTTSAGAGPAAVTYADMLADVLSRAGDAAVELAGHAAVADVLDPGRSHRVPEWGDY